MMAALFPIRRSLHPSASIMMVRLFACSERFRDTIWKGYADAYFDSPFTLSAFFVVPQSLKLCAPSFARFLTRFVLKEAAF